MIPVTKVPKQSVSATLLEKKKRLREREKNSASKKYPADAKSRFGRVFQTKMSQLLLSNSPTAEQQLQTMYDEVFESLLNYYNEHDLNEMWLSDDNEDSEIKPPVSKKMHNDAKVGLIRSKNNGEEKDKGKSLISNASVTPANNAASVASAVATTVITTSTGTASNLELTDDSDDEQKCSVCGEGNGGSDTSTNILLECDECKNLTHMKCSKFEITMQQALDSRFVFVCSTCRDREAKTERGGIAESTTKSSIGSKEEKSITHKLDISAAFATFAAKKRHNDGNLVFILEKVASNPSHQSALPSNVGISRAANNLQQNTSKTFPSFLKK
uniref:PHD-type domain-containing protein n=1 Tax=Syphacia muris TaxID=451379 RepID=A0A0N5APX6_9BILA